MIETNDLNKNAMGGTELMGHALHKHVDGKLLEHFQIIQSRVRDIDPNKIPILWLHDLPGDPESEHLKAGGWNRFEKIVFVSHWQQQAYHRHYGIPYSKGIVLQNAIEPIEDVEKPDDKIRIIYHTTPHRGLAILVPVFKHLCTLYPNLELDVYSSFKIYGWEQRDEPYKALFEECRQHPNINYHGTVSNEEVRKALGKAHIFAYPSIWPETSCISLIEAMSAKCICIHPTLAALPETSSNLTFMYPYNEDKRDHAQAFFNTLATTIEIISNKERLKTESQQLQFMKVYVDSVYNWKVRKMQWEMILNNILNEKNVKSN